MSPGELASGACVPQLGWLGCIDDPALLEATSKFWDCVLEYHCDPPAEYG